MQNNEAQKTEWQGKSKGNVLGYQIFVFCIRHFGVRFAYFVLYFVAFYYFVFERKLNQYSYYYFRERLGFSKVKAWKSVYKNYFVFGQTILDKITILAGFRNQFTYDFDGIENLQQLLKDKKGGVLISAHIGNFEISEHFFAEIDLNYQINIVTADLEHSAIKTYVESISEKKSSNKFIIIKEDLSHIFDINKVLSNNEVICFTGDRYFQGNKLLKGIFLGKEAHFPAGPFMIASRLGVPVIFVYVMKEKNLHYHLYARMANTKHRDAQGLLNAYIQNMEQMVKKYPLQWFNFFDFWEEKSE
ncbi:MAG: lipid A biosynthesis acyltransferase [Capnocytophaga sp.]|nr:lipid A biosynthesis acyltransferase [Capnocytophaga sp.]